MKRIVVLITGCFFSINLNAQTNILDDYVKQGLESNLAIKQNQMALESAQYALKVAKGMYLPTLSTQSRYTLSKGGRTIDFPMGDLLNPVYSTLNDLIAAHGGTPQFPTVDNQHINFLREKEYEAKLSLVQPVYYPSIGINKSIEESKLSMSQTELEQYKRELTFQIKEAYYNSMKANHYFDLIQKTKELVQENYRVSQKLMENNMITRDAVLRAKSEIGKVFLYETEAMKSKEMAKSYFNFLLNRDLESPITISSHTETYLTPDLSRLSQNALQHREELQLLDYQIGIINRVADLHNSESLPKLLVAVDYGIQGEDFKMDGDASFVTGSLVLKWNIFSGNTNRNKKQQALIEKQRIQYYKEEVSSKILLEVKQNVYDVAQQSESLKLARTRCNEAIEFYRIIEKRFQQGEIPLLELLDARNNMTESEIQLIVIEYDYLISIAKLEKCSSLSLRL